MFLQLLAVSQAYGMMIEGNDMTMDDAIIKAGSNNSKSAAALYLSPVNDDKLLCNGIIVMIFSKDV